MKTVDVDLGYHRYPIYIGPSLIGQAPSLIAPILARKKLAIVTDENVADAVLGPLVDGLDGAGIQSDVIIVPAGEATKSWSHFETVVDGLLGAKIERDDKVIALGGGVVGDLVGFAAAVLRRGVRFVQIPTSLLAQVDSSVGGKTGINSTHGKNLIGAFHQPEMVIADLDVLKSLPKREFLSGYGEVVKYGLLGDADFFAWLEDNLDAIIAQDADALAYMVAHCCQMKADIVVRDEKERGDRALLNLGHTFGHALEKVTGYSDKLLHGEAVAIGCLLAMELSAKMGVIGNNQSARLSAHLNAAGMKSKMQDIGANLSIDALMDAMAQDKKVSAGKLNMIALHALGDAFVAKDVDPAIVRAVWQEALAS